jgi:hypothetical protein
VVKAVGDMTVGEVTVGDKAVGDLAGVLCSLDVGLTILHPAQRIKCNAVRWRCLAWCSSGSVWESWGSEVKLCRSLQSH